MEAGGKVSADGERWLFTAESLARAREVGHYRAIQSLSERRPLRDPSRVISLEEGNRLVQFYAQKVPELCRLCGAPTDVRWTSVVFYRRFFAVSSPLEFDPLPIMFACVHVACKIEEARDITLDKLLEAAELASDETLKSKVADLELDVLEGVGFVLLVEPKPDCALHMLIQDIRHLSQPAAAAKGLAVLPPSASALSAADWTELAGKAEILVLDLAVRSDAVLLYPASVLIAAGLALALNSQFGHEGHRPPSEVLRAMLTASIENKDQRKHLLASLTEAEQRITQLASADIITQEQVEETVKLARRFTRAFDRLREDKKESHEAHRKERKRRRDELKAVARRQVPTPMLKGELADLKRRAKALQGHSGQHSEAQSATEGLRPRSLEALLSSEAADDRRPTDDMEQD